jgi:hypothetical protein
MSLLHMLAALLLLLFVNFVPPFLNLVLGKAGNRPLDGGRVWRDGNPLFGPHKTVRGLVGGILGGTAAGWVLGYGVGLGLGAGLAAMAGDLCSSFIKRRLGRGSGKDVPGLDQFFEGGLPLLVLGLAGRVTVAEGLAVLVVFCVTAYFLSQFYKTCLLVPDRDTPRAASAAGAVKDYLACRMRSPFALALFSFREKVIYGSLVPLTFRLLGLERSGERNALEVGLTHVEMVLPGLPHSFDGYRILFMSDLHLDGHDEITDRLLTLVRGVSADLCLLGGDYRFSLQGPYEECMARMARLLGVVQCPDGVLAVLGNHDCPEMAEYLRGLDVTVLINEAANVVRDEERLWIAGIDDPYYYRASRVQDAMDAVTAVDPGGFAILLAHSPCDYDKAAAAGARLYLCGHTHSGQVRLPVLGPVVTHTCAPKEMINGPWEYQGMRGYTSAGAGTSGATLRLGTRGEVVVLTLRRAKEGE